MKRVKICILDYGSGNIQSVFNLFSSVHDDVVISREEKQITDSTHMVLPGVGAFATAMEKIHKNLPLKLIEHAVLAEKKPFLGICVGMQVLATQGEEYGVTSGLNWIPGIVKELEANSLPLPHIGWNDIQNDNSEDPILKGLDRHRDFYFVHKYHFIPDDMSFVLSTTNYGCDFCSIVRKENIYGFQFHPEKSQQAGRKIALNFLGVQ